MPAVSLLATLPATVLGFLLGGIWYGPPFGKAAGTTRSDSG